MSNSFRALCAELLEELEHTTLDYYLKDLKDRARAALAVEPEPPDAGEVAEEAKYLAYELRDQANDLSPSFELFGLVHHAADLLERLAPQPVPEGPTDAELLELMPQQFRDDLATVSRLAAHGTSPDVTPGIFRVTLNTGAIDYARAVLARWGRP